MIETYRNIKKLKYNQYFKTWIIKILINKCNKQYRKNKKENISYEQNNLLFSRTISLICNIPIIESVVHE